MVNSKTSLVVAIDGPAGAGKSTTSRRVARELGYVLLDTGALYRCVGLLARELMNDPAAVSTLATDLAARGAIAFEQDPSGEGQRVLLDGRDVTVEIRSQEISTLASRVSAIPGVRSALLAMQRSVGRRGGVVVEGRDIGTVVFPEARAKFFLTASVAERARRRHEELQVSDPLVTVEQVQADVADRDRRDSQRPVAPLVRADDAELLDSTQLTQDEVVAQIVRRVRELELQ